jgi:hypothetical protein
VEEVLAPVADRDHGVLGSGAASGDGEIGQIRHVDLARLVETVPLLDHGAGDAACGRPAS